MSVDKDRIPKAQMCAKEGCHLAAEDECRECRSEGKSPDYCWAHSAHPGHDHSLEEGRLPMHSDIN